MTKIKLLFAVISLSVSSTLLAHGMMGGSYPQDGAMMMEPTDRVEVEFKTPMKLINLKLIDANGKPVSIDFERSKDAGKHFKAMTPNLPQGNYTVHWKAMGEDGHMMKGRFGFMQH